MDFFVKTVTISLFFNYGTGFDCPLMYRSVGIVCGTDSVTYRSLCELEVARIFDNGLDIAYFGECTTYCRNEWDPVCGTDLNTYVNICTLEMEARVKEKLDVLHWGQCESGDENYELYEKKKRYVKLMSFLTKALMNNSDNAAFKTGRNIKFDVKPKIYEVQ